MSDTTAPHKALGETINSLMKARGLKAYKLGEKVGLSPTTVSKIVHGVSRPRQSSFKLISEALCETEEERNRLMAAFAGMELSVEKDKNDKIMVQSIEGPEVKVHTNMRIAKFVINTYCAALAMFDELGFTPIDVNNAQEFIDEYGDLLGDIARSWRAENIKPINDSGGLDSLEEYLHLETMDLFQTSKLHALRQCVVAIAEIHHYG